LLHPSSSGIRNDENVGFSVIPMIRED